MMPVRGEAFSFEEGSPLPSDGRRKDILGSGVGEADQTTLQLFIFLSVSGLGRRQGRWGSSVGIFQLINSPRLPMVTSGNLAPYTLEEGI